MQFGAGVRILHHASTSIENKFRQSEIAQQPLANERDKLPHSTDHSDREKQHRLRLQTKQYAEIGDGQQKNTWKKSSRCCTFLVNHTAHNKTNRDATWTLNTRKVLNLCLWNHSNGDFSLLRLVLCLSYNLCRQLVLPWSMRVRCVSYAVSSITFDECLFGCSFAIVHSLGNSNYFVVFWRDFSIVMHSRAEDTRRSKIERHFTFIFIETNKKKSNIFRLTKRR